jgi:peptidyl-dipeptidase A
MNRNTRIVAVALAFTVALVGAVAALAIDQKPGSAADAKKYIAQVNHELKKIYVDAARAEWVKENFITDDTDVIAAQANEAQMNYTAAAIKTASSFQSTQGLDADTARSLYLLRVSPDLPALDDAQKTAELSEIASKMDSMYGKGKYNGRDLDQLSDVMKTSRNYDELLEVWQGWHSIAQPMRPLYTRYVDLANQGSRDLGFRNLADIWRGRYDATPEQFEADMDRVWAQLQPMYDDLHCYVRTKLASTYPGKVDDKKPIPAHLLGNMWAQEWQNIYDLVAPYPNEQGTVDVDAALKAKNKSPIDMVKMGESFFVSLGFDPLPKSFWERSLFVKPRDRDVVCHASAWDITYDRNINDLRIKVCIEQDEDHLITLHHELGHIFYYQSYNDRPLLFQQGANDGFHEAIGDAIARSVTPDYLHKIGLLDVEPPKNEHAVINQQMKKALEKVAFLPFAFAVDKWRWDVFSGKTPPTEYNKHWWDLRTKYQGVSPAVARGEEYFDPGAKYHVAANTPYARYFLAAVMQFQFHKAMCDAAGFKGPLHECSIYGNKKAGERLKAMLSLGASKPWPDAMQVMTGQRKLDAGPMLEYFAPLRGWLKQQNRGKKCGW